MNTKEKCNTLCEDVSLLEDSLFIHEIELPEEDKTTITNIHDSLCKGDITEHDAVTLMLIAEKVRDDYDPCLLNIMHMNCLQLIGAIRAESEA